MEDYILSEHATADDSRPNLNKQTNKQSPWRQSVNVLTHFHQDCLNYALLKRKFQRKETEPFIYSEHWLPMWRVHKLKAK